MILKTIVVGELETNSYILGSEKTKEAVIIDPGDDYEKIIECLKENGLKARSIINTHGHIDHIGADYKFDIPILIHKEDSHCLTNPEEDVFIFFGRRFPPTKPSRLLKDGDKISVGDIEITVIHTPGHTPGGICLKYDKILFTGDTLFAGGIGRTDFPGGSADELMESIREKLMTLDEDVTIYPGHGPTSTIGDEKRTNPFL